MLFSSPKGSSAVKFHSVNPYSISNLRELFPYHQIMTAEDGSAISVQGVTAFKLLNLYENDIHKCEDFLSIYGAFNAFRVFTYTPVKDWGNEAWDVPKPEVIHKFIEYMASKAKYVKLCLLTDDDNHRLNQAIAIVQDLSKANYKNVLLEAGNEPLTHKNINVDAMYEVLHNSTYLYTSGIYENTKKFYGVFGNDHSARDSQWPRKAHNLLECYNGGGPNSPDEPATRVPWCEDEPIKPTEALNFGSPESVLKDYYAYAATCTQFGFGGTFHCESAKYCNLPSDFELECAQHFLRGLDVFPADTALGDYERIDEFGNTLRTYRVGNTLTRIRPVTPVVPSGWTSIDEWGICAIR